MLKPQFLTHRLRCEGLSLSAIGFSVVEFISHHSVSHLQLLAQGSCGRAQTINTIRVRHIVHRQESILGVIISSQRDTPTSPAPVIQQLLDPLLDQAPADAASRYIPLREHTPVTGHGPWGVIGKGDFARNVRTRRVRPKIREKQDTLVEIGEVVRLLPRVARPAVIAAMTIDAPS